LTVLFCDLVGSTTLSEQLDPEEYREVVRSYQATCTEVILRYEGHTAQHLGDGILVYFGYPVAHEDDAQRAVRTGLEIVAALQHPLPARPVAQASSLHAAGTAAPHVAQASGLHAARMAAPPEGGKELQKLQVRIGIHTGLVVVGEIGSSEKREILALGEAPNIAARLQGLAAPDTVVLSAITQRLVTGLFECQELGPQTLKGISIPLSVYRVVRESGAQSRFEVAVQTGLTPLVGRDLELGLLRERWAQVKGGAGQVVLLSGEPGIGKSRLVQTLKEQVMAEGVFRIEFRCSPYHQNSAFYPIIEHLQRLLQFQREDTPQTRLTKLQQALAAYRFPQTDTLPLLAALLSLPHPESMPSLALSLQKQKQRTQEALVAWVVEEAERQAVYCAWEDLHWADPSSLEVLTLLLEQVPTTRLLAVLTCRPDFTPPWRPRSHFSQLMLSRLGRPQVETMVEKVTGGKALPAEVLQQIVAKTDGVPLFVEELTKMVMESVESIGSIESVESVEGHGRSPIPLGIPATLQDALMARLDRLGTVKEVAQLGATLGREFSYEVLHAVSPLDQGTLQQGLRQLVEAELIYQRGLPPQATYLFKHALVQDAAYQSLLKSKRQQYHQQIAQVLAERFPETAETQPELLAHHYTEASLIAQAIPYWQQAGQRASWRSANAEAISHLTKGLELLKTLPDTPERTQQELSLQLTLGVPLMGTRGYAAPELEKVYARARALSQQVGETPQLGGVLYGLWAFYCGRVELHTARELAEQLFTLAQRTQDPLALLRGRFVMARILPIRGEFVEAREHAEQGIGLYDRYRSQRSPWVAHHCGVGCLNDMAWVLWLLGYPDQALRRAQEALVMAQEMAHPMTLAEALSYLAWFHQNLRERQTAEERAAALVTLCTEQGFPLWQAEGTIVRGWALTEQGREEEGVTQIRQGLADYRATGAELKLPDCLALLAAVYKNRGQAEEGLKVVIEALARVEKTGGRLWEAELYRLKGQLTLQKFQVSGFKFQVQESPKSEVRSSESEVPNTQHPTPSTQAEAEREAEECFLKAIDIARKQQAKSWELRATLSLVRLRQQQAMQSATRDTQHAARNTLSEIYTWFTEGFDTADLKEAKALLENLS
jgi:class 3 adenylate cyclase/predicted ATPase